MVSYDLWTITVAIRFPLMGYEQRDKQEGKRQLRGTLFTTKESPRYVSEGVKGRNESCQCLRQVGLLYDRWRHHLSPPPQFRYGTGREGNILQPSAPAVKTFGPTDSTSTNSVCTRRLSQVTYSQFGLAIHPNNPQATRRFAEWAQSEMAVVPDFHKRILFSDEAHFWLNGYVNGRIWSEANPQVYVETPLHPEKLTVWCALWAGGILLQKR
ncbi:uncharacterized protein TNCV_447771 [Trichonephila clavipes]|nr:uncharacterized protein TNCV_447771 [Trichonephila clavipes]